MTETTFPFLEAAMSADIDILKIALFGYFGLLWISIIVWVTRDSINRSGNLFFQTFSILLNIIVPILGVLLYLIIRPNKTNMEKYYEEIEHRLLTENAQQPEGTCEKCLTSVNSSYVFCPNCGEKMQQSCQKCKKGFPNVWHICPYCGTEQEKEIEIEEDVEEEEEVEEAVKKKKKHSK